MKIDQKIYLDLEPDFIYDYIHFSVNLRYLQSQENSYKKYSHKQTARAMCLVNLLETYQKSLEDISAVLLAFFRRYNSSKECNYQNGFKAIETPLVYTLINYQKEAVMNNILQLAPRKLDIINKFGLKNIENININLIYPNIVFEKIYSFFIEKFVLLGKDQNKRDRIYNKIKHGGVVVSDGKLFSKGSTLHAPATVYSNRKSNNHSQPLIMHSLKYDDQEFELLQLGILLVKDIITTLLSIYLCKEYKSFLVNKGFRSPLELLEKMEVKKRLIRWKAY